MAKTSSACDQSVAPGTPLSRRLKLLLSALVVFHLAAVFLPPLAFQASGPFGASRAVTLLETPVRGYGEFMYLNRGYAFFAPDPGPSHLIQAAVLEADGQTTESLYPDLDRQWPRLSYHRHFMLAEFLNDMYVEPGPPDELIQEDREAADDWARRRDMYERVRESIANHLKHVNDGKETKIRRIEHLIPNFRAYVENSMDLADQESYIVLLDTSGVAEGPPEAIPAPGEEASQPLQAPRDGANENYSADSAADDQSKPAQQPAAAASERAPAEPSGESSEDDR